jgi:4-aminobutyrate aminotransferase/(S)-3-amino-2-methylpropionate transaminase
MFASEHFGLEPDLITMAKSMSNGFPVSAVVGRAEIMDSVQPGGLGGTFGGNPVSCAAALAAIRTIEKHDLCGRSTKLGETVREKMLEAAKQVKCIGEVRGLGAMIAVEIVKDGNRPDKDTAEKIVGECGKRGLLMLTAGLEGNVIRMLMPLSITDDQLIEGLSVVKEVMVGL